MATGRIGRYERITLRLYSFMPPALTAFFRVILGFAKGILAPLIAYAAIIIVTMLPVWYWGWLADPINLSHISIWQIIIIVIFVGMFFWGLPIWIVALTVLPAALIQAIAPPFKWMWVGTAGLLVCLLVATQALVIIAYNTGCIRISDGLTSIAVPLPIGFTIYTVACALLASGGLLFNTIYAESGN
jgi:hypothetical protein